MLKLPDNKVVITSPDYPSVSTEKDGKSSSSVKTAVSKASTPTVKEMLTKGVDNTVPALPVLPPTEDGNFFAGWVNKATNEPVKKGDKLTGNIEIIPVWKDCGRDKHTDANNDYACDDCGYKLPIPEQPVENPTDKAVAADALQDKKGGSIGGIAVLAAAGIAAGCCYAVKKKNNYLS